VAAGDPVARGLGILILATAVLSEVGVGGAQLMETESQTQDVNKLTPKISQTAQLIWGIYFGLTGLAVVVYFLLGLAFDPQMDLYNAVAHAFTSVATAGFSPEPLSVGAFHPIIQWAVVPFMVIGSTSFVLIYFAINGEPMRLLRNEEFHFYLGVMGTLATIVAVGLFLDPGTNFGAEGTIRHAVFNVTSIVTTTGYASTDYVLWAPAAKHMLFMGMFIGGMVGSTTCSIKSLRWLVALKSFRRNLYTAIHPEAVRPVRISGNRSTRARSETSTRISSCRSSSSSCSPCSSSSTPSERTSGWTSSKRSGRRRRRSSTSVPPSATRAPTGRSRVSR